MICGNLHVRKSSVNSLSGNEENIIENLENGEFIIYYSMDAVFNMTARNSLHKTGGWELSFNQ